MNCESNSDKENIGYIYAITNEINGKIYIGQTERDVNERLNEHKRDLINNNHWNAHLQRSVNKYGVENFTFEPLSGVPIDELDTSEKLFIAFFDSSNPKKGYNKEKGGRANKEVSEETRKRMSKANKEVWKNEEYRKKMSEKMRGKNHPGWGKPRPEETRKKISKTQSERYNTTGFYKVYKSKDNALKQGFRWSYQYRNESKKQSIMSLNLLELKDKVEDRGLPWKILDEEKAKKSLEENEKVLEKVKNIPNGNKGKTRSLEQKKTTSKATNTTGFFRVSKYKDNTCTQGFLWCYRYENKKIKRVNLLKLQEEVKSRGLPWEILDEEKAKKSLEENSKYH